MRPWEPDANEFSRQMAIVASCFNAISLEEALEGLSNNSLPERALCVTFDDGYADNLTIAAPIMRRFRVPATIFVSTDYLDGGRMWNDSIIESIRLLPEGELSLQEFGFPTIMIGGEQARRVAAEKLLGVVKYAAPNIRNALAAHLGSLTSGLPNDLMLTRHQLMGLTEAGFEIGAHTCSHPILTEIGSVESEREIVESKLVLEKILRKPVRYFAYPNGKPEQDYSISHREIVKNAGYEAALSTHPGVADSFTDKWQLPRFTPWDRSTSKFLIRMALNARHPVHGSLATS